MDIIYPVSRFVQGRTEVLGARHSWGRGMEETLEVWREVWTLTMLAESFLIIGRWIYSKLWLKGWVHLP